MGLLYSFFFTLELGYFCVTLQVKSMAMRAQRASAVDVSRAVILQCTHWLHLLLAISFLALLHADSFPSPFLASLLFPSSGASSLWGKGEAASLGWGGLSLSHQLLLCTSILCFSAWVCYFLVLSLSPCYTCGLSRILYLPKVSWGKAQWILWNSKCGSWCGLWGCKWRALKYLL